jgi:hypothetical protein
MNTFFLQSIHIVLTKSSIIVQFFKIKALREPYKIEIEF